MIDYDKFKNHESVIGKLPLIPLPLVGYVSQNVGEFVEYRGMKLRWTGFMMPPDNERVICRWQCHFKFVDAERPIYDAIGLVAINTGYVGFYRMGETFDLTQREGFAKYCWFEELLYWPERIQEIKEKTLQMLKDAIDFNWDIIINNG